MVLHLQVWESRSPPIQDSPVIIRISQYEISMQNYSDVTTSVKLSWTCRALVPPHVLVSATFRSKATGLFQPSAECRRGGVLADTRRQKKPPTVRSHLNHYI